METIEGIALRTRTDAEQIALRGVRIRARVAGMSQRTTVEQTFVNQESSDIEAIYTFPLPAGAAVCHFEVVTADRVLTGAVEEIQRAYDQYDQAVADGHGAFMIERDRPDIFTVRVGNLRPRQAVTVRLTYVAELAVADRGLRLSFPTTIAPRYVSGIGRDPLEAMADGELVNPPHVLHVPYGLSLTVEVDLGRPVRSISSPSHAIRVEAAEGGASRVTLAGGVAEMDRDVVLQIELPQEVEPWAQADLGPDGDTYVAVTFVPQFDQDDLAEPRPAEVVFVIDCSGSMEGRSIAEAKLALELCLRSLSMGDRFNIVRFGSTHQVLSPQPLVYDQRTLDHALQYVRGIRADLGGTELYPPLESILLTPPIDGVRQIVLLTDGQISNEDAVIQLAGGQRERNRIFSFGIGAAASEHLVRGLARATGGAAEFVAYGERIDDKVLRTFSRLGSPMVGDVQIDWGKTTAVLADPQIPPIFDGDALTVYAHVGNKPPRQATLRCHTPAGRREWAVAIPRPVEDEHHLATLWARARIEHLESTPAAARGPRARSPQQWAIEISKRFGILCRETTFIAIEHRSLEDRAAGTPAVRRVPVMLAAGWGGVERYEGVLECTVDFADSNMGSTAAFLGMPAAAGEVQDLYTGSPRRSAKRSRVSHISASLSAPMQPDEADARDILILQTADGGFHGIGPFESIDDADVDRIRRAVGRRLGELAKVPPLARDGILETVVALLLLRLHLRAHEGKWRRAYRKGCHCLAKVAGRSKRDVEAWLDSLAAELAAKP